MKWCTSTKNNGKAIDAAELATVPRFGNVVEFASRAGANKGFRWGGYHELFIASKFKGMNFTISEFRLPAGGSDIDVVARMGTQVVYIQAKSTARAFASGKGKAALFDKDYEEWLKAAEKTTRKWDKIAKKSDESAQRIWAYSGDIALPQKMVDLIIRELEGTLMKIDLGV